MKELKELASVIAKIEGKKSQARIGDIREILKIIVLEDVYAIQRSDGQEVLWCDVLCAAAYARAEKLKKKK